jgi:hypothetical protein
MNNLSDFRILNIFLNDNILPNMIYILFIFVLSSLIYGYEINAIDETNGDAFDQNDYLEKSNQNNHLRIINYPNSNISNLTNNKEDSIYGQIEAFGNNVYIVWEESVTKTLPKHNYDIFFVKSEDKGKTFSMPINLSNNTNLSEHPQIAVSKNGIFIVWAEKSNSNSNNKEIIFTKSIDNGKTFSKVKNLSNSLKVSNNQEISAFDENVCVVWQESDQNNNTNDDDDSIIFRGSNDTGNTFNHSIELTNNNNDSIPKIKSYGNYVYIVWNNENKKNGGLFFVKSSDKGNSFDDEIIKLSNGSKFGESQIAVDENELLVIWGGLQAKNIDNIYYVKSNDNGSTFTDSKTISAKMIGPSNRNNYFELDDIISNPLNVEVTNNNISYAVWQNTFSKQNEDILLLVLSNHKDNKYAKLLNLSNNIGVSECPSIAISGNNIYVIWEDYTPGNHEILFANPSIDIV